MLKIRTYSNKLYPDQKIFHIHVPEKYHYMGNCLILKLRIYPKCFILLDNGDIFKSIKSDYVTGRVNSLTYRHSVNRYAVTKGNNLQVMGKSNLVNVIYRKDKHHLYQGMLNYIHFIRKIYDSGIQFKNVY